MEKGKEIITDGVTKAFSRQALNLVWFSFKLDFRKFRPAKNKGRKDNKA